MRCLSSSRTQARRACRWPRPPSGSRRCGPAKTRLPDRLLDDPWAAALAGPHGEDWLEERAGSQALTDIIIRARFFDDFLQRVTGTGEVRQVVLLAAGLDTRGYRLSWPDRVQVFELDQAGVLDRK